jgi:hypothetical protein
MSRGHRNWWKTPKPVNTPAPSGSPGTYSTGRKAGPSNILSSRTKTPSPPRSASKSEVLSVGNDQTGQVLSEMPSFGFVSEVGPKSGQDLIDDSGKLHNSWYSEVLPDFTIMTSDIHRQIAHFDFYISDLQNSSP